MIRSLRRSHAVLAIGLALFGPAAVLMSILSRAEVPVVGPDLPGIPTSPADSRPLAIDGAFPIQVRVWSDTVGPATLYLTAVHRVPGADPLLYWAPDDVVIGAGLPAGSVFVAPVGVSRPSSASLDRERLGAGHFVLVSGPDRRAVATTPAPTSGER